jgi:radical SAM superfamily enzyme YgiQ (UPF0313 family)
MKIALIYPPSEQQFLPVPPLGIFILASYLKNKGVDVTAIDLELELWLRQGMKSSSFSKRPIVDILKTQSPINVEILFDLIGDYDILGFSIMGKRQLPYVKAIIKYLENVKNKTLKYIIGGIFISDENAFDVLRETGAHCAIIGEGGLALYESINYLQNKKCNTNAVSFNTNNSGFIAKMNHREELVIANYENANIEGYIKQQKYLYKIDYDKILFQILVGDRCCPYTCNFCRIGDKTDRIKPVKEIINEIDIMVEKYGATNFSMICNEMNPTPKYLLEFISSIIELNIDISWHCYLRPDPLDKNIIKILSKSGCRMVRFGVESGSQRILNLMNKQTNIENIERILKAFHDEGIWNHINIMAGYLYETNDDINKTIEFLERNVEYIDSIRVNPFFLPTGSPLANNPDKFGIEIIKDAGSHLLFRQKDLNWEEKQNQIYCSTQKILSKCLELNIGFAGIIPNIVATGLSHFRGKDATKTWLKDNHPYLWEPISPDSAKWMVAHPDNRHVQINPWLEIAGKRGENYDTKL